MNNDVPKEKLRSVYADVVRGYSVTHHIKYGAIYVKHLSMWDTEELDIEREKYLNQAEHQGLPDLKEKIKMLEVDGLWGEKKEADMAEQESFLIRMEQTRKKLLLKSERARMTQDIEKEKTKLEALKMEKSQLVGLTSELFADKKVNEYYIYLALHKDKELKEPLLSLEQFDELSDNELSNLVVCYNGIAEMFKERNMKRVAISGFFLNNYYLCKDNPFIYYGKPLVDLTYHQSDLFSYGRYFKHLLQEMKNDPPPDIMEDPDKLLEHYELQKQREQLDEGRDRTGEASTIVGATKEDLEALGMNATDTPGTVNLNEELKKTGGNMSMEDMIKLHGV